MKKIYCMHCGYPNEYGDHFCIKCGAQLVYGTSEQQRVNPKTTSQNKNIFQNATRTINSWTGEDKSVQINFKNFFAQVWKSHTEAEAENIFVAGTQTTTPTLDMVSSKPVQPWLYSRIFLGFLVILALLYFSIDAFQDSLDLAFVMILCISVPVTLVMFFFEVNVFKNISFYLTTKIFLIGGLMSLIVTLLLYSILGSNPKFDILGSLSIGFIEETGKLLVGCYFVSKMRLTHVFNGMLIGGAVGAGFAAFENIQYATKFYRYISDSDAIIIAVVRCFSSLGSHAIWCAITVAALVLVNGNRPLTFSNIANISFFRFFLCSMILHALWDWDISTSTLKYVLLICVGWLILFVLIHTGLREVKFIQKQLNDQTN